MTDVETQQLDRGVSGHRVALGAGVTARLVKAALDRLASAALLIVLAPLLLVIALLVRVTSPGPVIYRRRVLGQDGHRFDAFKFRSMVADADDLLRTQPELLAAFEANVKIPDDPRVTRLGRILRRSSLDELPQLFNVLCGQMSLVGPRIITPEEAVRYGDAIEKRLSVKPGLTGLWQVSGRQNVDYSQRVVLDLQYIDNWSLLLDVVILLKTIPAVLSMRGAY
ncbi:MAG: undecaprenyl-phosphate galactose phosphotransferase [Deltaproteobacteria bacterium]|jgi:lipopolysaccharide/colanic/teichoic acid biosynthesis glycosyltransferase|nr:undecaprenyl-phosphate galactose phosphotransferase [Deltaproteobacteria bacterium]